MLRAVSSLEQCHTRLSGLGDATSPFSGNVSQLLSLAGDGQSRYCGPLTGFCPSEPFGVKPCLQVFPLSQGHRA